MGNLVFLSVYGDKGAEDTLLNNWGNSWRIVTPGMWFRLYPFCSAAYHAADAAMELVPYIQNPDEIERVRVLFPPDRDAALVQRYPSMGEQGRFTIIEIDTVNGKSYRSRVDFPKGSPHNPVKLPELKEKIYQSIRQDQLSSNLLQAITELEDRPHLQNLISLL
jgi:2-methylcitrate dehydratase PrpD